MAIVKKSRRKATLRASVREPRVRLDLEERRRQLIELGLQHFGERPYDEVSVDALAEAAGISKGLLYHYFSTKRAYYAATVREGAARLLASASAGAVAGDGADPLASLEAGLDAYLTYVKAHAKAYATLMRSGVGVDPEIARIVDETRATFVDRLIAGFAGSGSSGLLHAPLVRLALRGWVGFAEAASLGWVETIAAGAEAPSQDEVRTMLGGAMMEIVRSALRGLAARA